MDTATSHQKQPTATAADAAAHAVKTTLVGVVVNASLAAIKGLAGLLGHSYALIADATESLMDIMQSLVVLGGIRIASVPPDDTHPYGHGKAEPLAAVVVAMGLIAVAVGLAIQSVREILAPHYAPAPFTLIVLVGVILVKETLFRFVIKVGRDVQSTAVKTDAWHHRSDAITSLAAFIGISIAVVGGEGYESADDWAALAACGIIGFNGYRLLRPAIAEVMDQAPDPAICESVRTIAAGVSGVTDLHTCAVRKMGFDYFVDLHVHVDGAMSVRRGHEVAHEVKNAICRANPRIRDVLVHIEPAEEGGASC